VLGHDGNETFAVETAPNRGSGQTNLNKLKRAAQK
jgi:hypothetical protein